MNKILASALAAASLLLPVLAHAADEKDFSPAERALFMSDHLRNMKPPSTLRYAFRKSGALEDGFEDTVTVALTPQPNGTCCAGTGEFLTGARRMQMPEVDNATGNPVIMYFLERDVREMNRLTKGSQSHFRKRLRMAIYNGASVKKVSLPYRGRTIEGQEVSVSPFLDDPNRPRYEKFAGKHYQFMLSDAVPGGVHSIRTQIGSASAEAPPLLVEELLAEGAESARKTTP